MQIERAKVIRLLIYLTAFVFILSATSFATYKEAEVKNGGTIKGIVKYQGVAPSPKKLEVTKDRSACGQIEIYSEELLVEKNDGIKNVAVYLKDIDSGKAFTPLKFPLVLDQSGCIFKPHVMIVPAGQVIEVWNNDGILYNLHTYSVANPPINMTQTKFKKKMTISFHLPEMVKAGCDVHPWMSAWIVVAEHPYYTLTDEDGSFTLTDIPAGSYTLEFWQEKFGRQIKFVTVTADKDVIIEVTYPGKK